LPDVKRYIGMLGYEVFNPLDWSKAANWEWVDQIIADGRAVLTVTEQTAENLWNGGRGEWSIFKQELDRFFQAGYRQIGDWLVPPTR
jgi:hypothetical protein